MLKPNKYYINGNTFLCNKNKYWLVWGLVTSIIAVPENINHVIMMTRSIYFIFTFIRILNIPDNTRIPNYTNKFNHEKRNKN